MKTSEAYTLSHLVRHPLTRHIILRHLRPVGIDEQQLKQVHTSLQILIDTNMGGGIPYEIATGLSSELNKIQ